MHNFTLNMVANLWHCPKPDDFDDFGAFAGAGTVGSTEACLLAGPCLKFRWREWYKKRHSNHDMGSDEVRWIYPNIVLSTCFPAAWERLFRYMDFEPKLVLPSQDTFTITAAAVEEQIDEKTIGVMCIMGNHYAGQYDPVWEIDDMLKRVNVEKGFQVGIHVDAASGGFVAPFQPELKPWEFRLENVLSISASGHKFGESCCGTGWVVWRQRKDLCKHVAISVSYLGGKADSYTLNFSRPATGVFVQYYKFLRLGLEGYKSLCNNRMANAKYLRDGLKAMELTGKPRIKWLDAGDTGCLPVVACCLNPDLKLPYDDIDLQHVMMGHHWYVSGYMMSFLDPASEQTRPLFTDAEPAQTMFRVVVKADVTRPMIEHLLISFKSELRDMDELGHGFKHMHRTKGRKEHAKGHAC